jgi:hypothetical protein
MDELCLMSFTCLIFNNRYRWQSSVDTSVCNNDSNPSVQVSAIEAGVMQQLIRMLSTDASISVRTRSLAALSSLVRQFPYAQRKFVDLGGLQALTDLLTHHSSATGMEKMCVKAVTLVNDLLQERVGRSRVLPSIVKEIV